METENDPGAECHAIIVEYHGDIDRGRATAAIAHFADDAQFEAHGQRLHGRAEILGFLTAREGRTDRHTVHLIANSLVRQVSDAEVAISALVMLHVRHPDGRYALDRVLDTVHHFRLTAAGWKIAARTSTPLHDSPTLQATGAHK
ncbi:nuclear transport factor 2 family protein [Pseudarthrobacter raffinosi]|uniref:nuclear transport factor 2 family protein n=1 Tax=Pseudarthrobacter raffinosi TaxID=2953651 RepID=UPI00208FAD4B|nr:nuclear transport factor 2 family protein [Pseudarthrobacter sp. MDT3-9]MCO4252146.1 nuclear transport factor 2 family protein [Pseudarthrobacter sp. MDT3-9]